MAKAKKLPSGSWSCLAYSHTEKVNGKDKRIYERFTAPTKKEAEYMAAEFQMNKHRLLRAENFTVKEALEKYINSKSNILSPSTIANYRKMSRNYYQSICDIHLRDLTSAMIQEEINLLSATLSPKTLRNIYALLTATLDVYAPDFRPRVAFPPSRKKEVVIPTEEQIKLLMKNCEGTELHLAILLASCFSLRRGEVCGILCKDVDLKNLILSINASVVVTENREWVRKAPKTPSGIRKLAIPPFLVPELKASLKGKKADEPLLTLTPVGISNKMTRLRDELGLKQINFKSLRHYYASMMLMNNVPDKYAMKRMGHATDNMLKNVYQHIIDKKDMEVTETINNYLAQTFH